MKRIRILTSQATPGMVISDDVYTTANQLIIPAGTAISNKVITRLKFYSIHQITVSVEDGVEVLPAPAEPAPSAPESAQTTPSTQPKPFVPPTAQVQSPPTVSARPAPSPLPRETQMYSEKVKNTPEFKAFSSSVEHSTEHLRRQVLDIVRNNVPIEEDELLSDINNVLKNARNGMHVFDMLHSMRDFDDETYLHSVNVALISNVLGRWLNFTERELDTLTLCGLLHDIGKLLIPPEIIKKPTALSDKEHETLMSHPLRGYNILRAQKANIHVQMSAMMHHERCDGTGYPLGIKGNQIDRFAKIVMVADVYEAMTAARTYRGPLCPFEIISIFESEGLAKYDTRTVMTFLEHVNQTYMNNNVRLNDKSEGVIIMMNRTSLSRPVIRVGGDRFIDLSREHDLYIEAIL
ncbi:MAG: HD domain-containing protein [Lachnospiraceae bacterium]|nr:HD domain-containing protein [Lachnospiraceae bacterium]